MTARDERFPCPCCGYVVFTEPPGSYEVCPICFWEDDPVQLRYVTLAGGANRPALIEAQVTFAAIGACEAVSLQHVRKPLAGDERDPGWRPASISDAEPDAPVTPVAYFFASADDGAPAPSAPREPYYWRRRARGTD